MRIHERSRRRASLAVVLVLPLFLMSFAAKCDGNKNNTPIGGVEFPDEADRRLGVDIRKAIGKNDRHVEGVSALDLHVLPVNGKVGITGTVANEAARQEVLRIARETEVEVGGKTYKALSVDDSQFTVKTPTPTPSPSSTP